ncbi:Metabotropic GABA-B receptor subtype 3A [Chytriomyces hyalinus]|nr:Metabotropic GABA-B receptor subtype 3A [Chytriomyces hyalinus]
MSISLGVINNYCTLKYMNFNGSLATNFTSKLDASVIHIDGNSGWAYLADLAIMTAIDDINSDPSILPGINVTLKRFTDCGPYYPEADLGYSGKSGGYASAVTATDIIENHKDVIGVIGNEFSNTARGLAQILSSEKIPYCSGSTGSPRYSDKNKYPYFWRTLSNSNGRYIAFLIDYWKIKRVSIIYENDNELGIATFGQMKSEMAKRNVEILSQIGLKTAFQTDAMQIAINGLRRISARYIVVSGSSAFVTSVIYPMGQAGLVGPDHVWIAYNRPKVPEDESNYRFLKGLIKSEDSATGSDSRVTGIHEKIMKMAGAEFGLDDFLSYDLGNFYDCTYMMLLGFHKLINSGLSAEDLSKRKFQSQMNISLWRSITNYSGLSMDPVMIDEFGDESRRAVFSRFTGNYRNTTQFAMSDICLSKMDYYNTSGPIFYDDMAIPPLGGGDVTVLSYGSEAFYSRAIIGLSVTGLCLSFASYFLLLQSRSHHVVRTVSVPEFFILITGCLAAYAGTIAYINSDSVYLCKARIWSLSLAQILIVSPLLSKSVFLVSIFAKGRIYKNERLLKKIQLQVRLLNCAVILIVAVILAFWSLERNVVPERIERDATAYWRCSYFTSKSKLTTPLSYLLYSYNGILIVGLPVSVYFEKSVQSERHDNSATSITVFTCFALTFLLVFGLLLGTHDFTTEFKICVCVWVAATLILTCTIGSMALELFSDTSVTPIQSHTNTSAPGTSASPLAANSSLYHKKTFQTWTSTPSQQQQSETAPWQSARASSSRQDNGTSLVANYKLHVGDLHLAASEGLAHLVPMDAWDMCPALHQFKARLDDRQRIQLCALHIHHRLPPAVHKRRVRSFSKPGNIAKRV